MLQIEIVAVSISYCKEDLCKLFFFYTSHHSLQTTLNKVLNSDIQKALWKKKRETITEVISVADNLDLQKARFYRQFS